jgi:hypothetical protein
MRYVHTTAQDLEAQSVAVVVEFSQRSKYFKLLVTDSIAKLFRHIVDFVVHDKEALHLFANAGTEPGHLAFLECIHHILTCTKLRMNKVSIHMMCQQPALTFCINKDTISINWLARLGDACAVPNSNVPKQLKQANDDRQKQLGQRKSSKKRFSQSLGFTTCACATNAMKFANLPQTFLKRFKNKKAYPPLKTWVYETPSIGKHWRKHLTSGRRADKRRLYLLMMQVDPKRLTCDVGIGESGTFCNADDGHLFALVVREFCPNGDVRSAADKIVQEAVSVQ